MTCIIRHPGGMGRAESLADAVLVALLLSEGTSEEVQVWTQTQKVAGFTSGKRTFPARYCHPAWRENAAHARAARASA